MRPLEWLIALVVVTIAVQWLRGRRAPVALAAVGVGLVVIHLVAEGQRIVMWPAYAVVAIALGVGMRRSPAGPPKHGALRTLGRALVFLIVVLLGVVTPWLWPVIKLPTPTGRYAIGTAWMVVRDSSRHERFGANRGGFRELPVKIWYPVAAGTRGKRAPYAEPAEASPLGIIPIWLNEQVRLVRTHALLGAPIDTTARFPVVIFSHGYTGYAAQNTPQMEELASHGYVVASITHTGEASWAPFPGGKGVPIDTGVVNGMKRMAKSMTNDAGKKTMDSVLAAMSAPEAGQRLAALRSFVHSSAEPLRSLSVAEWSLDTRATIDVLAMMNAGSVASPFKGRLDVARIGVTGMSYGGAAAGEFCRQDSRCRVAVNLDGGQYGRLVDDSLTVPLLIIGSEQAYAVHLPVLDLARAPAYLVKVPKTTHIGLTDMTLQGPTLFRLLGVTGRLDPDRREEIMSAFMLAFLDKYLAGRPGDAFERLGTRFPEVTIQSRNVGEPRS